MNDVVIVSASRTPIGSFGGSLSMVPATDLGATAISAALKKINIDPSNIDEVIMGNILSAGTGMNPARQAAIKAGIPISTPAMTINKMCGSGLKAVVLATQAIRSGDATTIIAGGMESMSQAPHLIPEARWGVKLGHGKLLDSMLTDGLYCNIADCHMGITAENLSELYDISREEMDIFACNSQHKTHIAIEQGHFLEEITPVDVGNVIPNGEIVSKDEHPRQNITLEKLSQLRPSFSDPGTVTAGNASGINDGAAAMVVMSATQAHKLGLTPLVSVTSYASAGVEPHLMGIGPVKASIKALEKCDLTINDMDLIELNEAFAAQSIAVGKELSLDWEITNVNGGAIALGHPIGASGARILTTLIYEIIRSDKNRGLATLCIGGGQGIAMVVQR